jgi:protein O-GlcNAc transferase
MNSVAETAGEVKLSQALEAGFKAHREGRLDEAEARYREVLRIVPEHADALHLLGLIAQQAGRFEGACELIGRAISQTKKAVYYYNLGAVLRGLKRFEEALASYDNALALEPDDAETFNNRGTVLLDLNRPDDALENFAKALDLQPGYADALINRGVALQKLNRIQEALPCYDNALAVKPDSAEALYNRGAALQELQHYFEALESLDKAVVLQPAYAKAFHKQGVTLHALKRFGEALTSFDKALAINPALAEAHYARGNALREVMRYEDALASYDRALALEPNYFQALGNRGVALQAVKNFDEALACYDELLALHPHSAEASYNRGVALLELKRPEDALASFEEALILRPDHAEAHYSRGNALSKLKRFEEALASYDQALTLKSDYLEAWGNRGAALQDLKRFDEALACYDEVVAFKPDATEAYHNRAVTLQELQRYDEALASCEKALALKPDYAEAYNDRGNALLALRRFHEALTSFHKALAIKSDYAEALNNRGVVLNELKRFDEALASYDKAIELKPDLADAFDNRGLALCELKRFDEALSSFEKALTVNPAHRHAFSGLMMSVNDLCDWDRRARLASDLNRMVLETDSIVNPWLALGYSSDASLHLRSARKYVADQCPFELKPLCHDRPRNREKLRIAYLSADFRQHPVASLIVELFELHDRTRFEIVGVSIGADDRSAMRKRVVAAFDLFIDARGMSDYETAKAIAELEIDIAVDLMGHTKDSRPLILAYRPAPILVAYLGYAGTTGADFIDYILADKTVAPFEHQTFYSERLIHLPGSFLVNDSKRSFAKEPVSRQLADLPDKGFVFCAFNQNWKITPEIFAVWMRLLKAVDGSVIWLRSDNDRVEHNLRAYALAEGVDPARLVFAARTPRHEDHLARHRLADLFLDTSPYNAHTTASDALWAGLPVLTHLGESFAGRVAASLLNAVGLPDLIARSIEEYEALALRLATDGALLDGYRKRLSENRLTYPLFDTDRFRRHIEQAYFDVYGIWRRGEQPRSFAVAPVSPNVGRVS